MANPFPPFAELTSTDFQQFQLALSPTALLDPTGTIFEASLGAAKDLFADRVRMSLKSRLPQNGPPDALTQIGAERGLPQGQSEGGIAYATRLQDAWNSWPWAGTAFGLLRAFYATGYTNVTIAQVRGGKEFTLSVSGTLLTFTLSSGIYETDPLSVPLGPLWNGFNWGGGTVYRSVDQTFWSKFDVILSAPFPANWVSGGIPSANSAEQVFIQTLVKAWRPAHATNNRIVTVLSGRVWGFVPQQQWGSFAFAPGPLWSSFNWGSSSNYANGRFYTSPGYGQFGASGFTFGGSNTVNWSGG